jgi:hypothetical protein
MSFQLSGRQWIITALTVITALIHLFLGTSSVPDMLGYAFIANGIIYLALIIALYFIPGLASQRSVIRWLLIAFAAGTFLLYFVFNWPNVWNPMGIITKLVELVLIVLLFLDRGP